MLRPGALSLPHPLRALGRRPAERLRDDELVGELQRRIRRRPSGEAAILVRSLAGQLSSQAFARLMSKLRRTALSSYQGHDISLVVSSRATLMRLKETEKEPFTVEWIEQSIRPGDVFYDVGANVGTYSLIAAKTTGNGARVFAFEPAANTFRDLCENVLLNESAASIVPLQIALWSESRLLSLTYRSLDGGAAKHNVERALRARWPLTHGILGVTIDDLVQRFGLPVPTHAKIDVDGSELEVLRGAAATLARPEWRSILLELSAGLEQRVRTELADKGFGDSRRHERPGTAYWTFTRTEEPNQQLLAASL
jgi:FkbM family methyltransferase